MVNQFSRTQLLIGEEKMKLLHNSRVAVFGVGGVGGFVVEALVRSGVEHIDIIDNDSVSLTNINRQIIATHKSVGRYKVDVMKERILDINPNCEVNTYQKFFLPENEDEFPFESWDYVVDAIDTVTGKIGIICKCNKLNIPVISSMGAGNKMNPQGFKVADIYKTREDPLAKVLRHELKKRGIKKLKVVYSEEKPLTPVEPSYETLPTGRRSIPGSNAFVPSSCGLLIASEVIKDLIK
jgi:tRNA threonylcarbamoyladenosine dehydratase